MKTFYYFLLLTLAWHAAQHAKEEIRVELATTQTLSPLYLGTIQVDHSAFQPIYVKKLEEILCFDLNHNGSTCVVPKDLDKEKELEKLSEERWKNGGVAHVVRVTIREKLLSVSFCSLASHTRGNLMEVQLTGDLSRDRRIVHKIADQLHKLLFKEQGVANSRILYSVQLKNGRGKTHWVSEIWECDFDGANARQITREGSYNVTPVFLPADPHFATDRFLYVSYKKGQPKIFIASLKQGEGERFISLRGNQLLPAISQKRDKVAFICDASGRADLFVQLVHPERGAKGKPYQIFSYPNSTQASPSFSPDGSQIAFVSDKDGCLRIYTISAHYHKKRAQPTLITKKNSESSCPAWSPDGKKLAYSAKTKGVRQIWIYDFETAEERQLTFGAGHKENPSWAPNSVHLVFNSTDQEESELYMVNLNQPDAIKITQGPGKKHYPSWGTS